MKLILPTIEYEASYSSYIRELAQANEDPIPWVLGWKAESFAALVKRLNDAQTGEQVDEGFVPHSTFWLIDGQDQVVGVANLRHELNEELAASGGHVGYGVRPSARRMGYATELLKRTRLEARRLGIRRVLVCCEQDNTASARVIQKNNGVFDSAAKHRGKFWVDRYWISCED